MGGVVKYDQILSPIACARKSQPWFKKARPAFVSMTTIECFYPFSPKDKDILHGIHTESCEPLDWDSNYQQRMSYKTRPWWTLILWSHV